MEGAVRGRAELTAPAFSIVSGDWLTASHGAFPADSPQGEELLARLEARRASRADYNRWVRDGADPNELARLAAEARGAKTGGGDGAADDGGGGTSIGSALADLEEVGYGYGEEYDTAARRRDIKAGRVSGGVRVEGARYSGVKPRGATPERLRRMLHGVDFAEQADADGGGAGSSEAEVDDADLPTDDLLDPGERGGERRDSTSDAAAQHDDNEGGGAAAIDGADGKGVEGDGESHGNYRVALQTELPSDRAAAAAAAAAARPKEPSVTELDVYAPPVEGETEIEMQLRCAAQAD